MLVRTTEDPYVQPIFRIKTLSQQTHVPGMYLALPTQSPAIYADLRVRYILSQQTNGSSAQRQLQSGARPTITLYFGPLAHHWRYYSGP